MSKNSYQDRHKTTFECLNNLIRKHYNSHYSREYKGGEGSDAPLAIARDIVMGGTYLSVPSS